MRIHNLSYGLGLVAITLFFSCEKDPVVPNEEELITTLTYTLIPEAGGQPVIFSFRDLDGDGGQDPVVSEGTLTTQTIYTGSIELLNETETPPADITAEVQTESEAHQFFLVFSNSIASATYTDMDANQHPIGITTRLTTADAGEGTLTIILRHLPDKSAAGVADGDPANAGGETDLEVAFAFHVE